jgi:hypothetical protein
VCLVTRPQVVRKVLQLLHLLFDMVLRGTDEEPSDLRLDVLHRRVSVDGGLEHLSGSLLVAGVTREDFVNGTKAAREDLLPARHTTGGSRT